MLDDVEVQFASNRATVECKKNNQCRYRRIYQLLIELQ